MVIGASASEAKRALRTTGFRPYRPHAARQPVSPLPENRVLVKSCAGWHGVNTIGGVEDTSAGVELPLRIQDEVACRHCDVHCEKVVYPGACLRMACPFVYAYEAWGHTYVGCMQKVYEVEIVGTYPHREDELGCRIPEFHELPRERATFRVFATVDG